MGPGAGGAGGPDMSAMAKMMQNQQSAMQKQMAGRGGGPGAMAGMPGAPGGAPGGAAGGAPGGAAADDGPADFHTPQGAVRSFLNALKKKDLDRLSESTALRASLEASSTKNQELFKKITDLNLSDSELDEIAKKLDGYTVAFENPPKSTGRVDVIIQKQSGNTKFSRKVTTRHEKKGWGVLDIAGATEFKPMPGMRTPKKGGRGY